MGRIVFGTGSGRCGTVSLAHLLDAQPRAQVTHEALGPVLTVDDPDGHADALLAEYMAAIQSGKTGTARILGDVMGTWIWHAKDLILEDHRVRVVCMKRNREETVRSFLAKKPDSNRWQKSEWDGDPWGRTSPWYDDDLTKRAAIRAYWEDVYSTADRLAHDFPTQFRVFPIQALNSESGVRSILDFVGVPKPNIKVGIRLNQGDPVNEL